MHLRVRFLNAVAKVANFAPMKRIAAREAKNRFGTLLDAAQGGPVCVTRKGRAVGVMMSMPHYERLRGAVWERLTATMDALGEKASANGLTEARLEALLTDES
ncbi:MAG: type II toxin-antitoxin system Phd/YefM family antitoxin [Rhodospirillaceae bacterium]|nr:type II toxin-antitoxin system Phd/YefM family antitoxin [Rhodospirillaceae bacterium]